MSAAAAMPTVEQIKHFPNFMFDIKIDMQMAFSNTPSIEMKGSEKHVQKQKQKQKAYLHIYTLTFTESNIKTFFIWYIFVCN